MDCIFCKIINGDIPSYKIYEDENTYAFLDIACDSYGHTLVIPKKHCKNVLDCNDKYLQAVTASVKKIAKHFVEDCGFDGVNVLNASGESAQQTVFHLHFHIIPRKSGDGLDTWALKEKFQFDLEDIHNQLKLD
ncbi:MAG: HIT family protein [Clostridia bacterium]|nr:HIT family protein [Clostridia bacterium]MDE7329032.1 HIT family protein [Clostridia bacterium]